MVWKTKFVRALTAQRYTFRLRTDPGSVQVVYNEFGALALCPEGDTEWPVDDLVEVLSPGHLRTTATRTYGDVRDGIMREIETSKHNITLQVPSCLGFRCGRTRTDKPGPL